MTLPTAILRELVTWSLVAWLYAASGADAAPWCKVRCGDGSTGSGTLVDVNNGQGLVVTAFHVVRDIMAGTRQQSTVVCEFPNGEVKGGNVVSFHSDRDLCAIVIRQPSVNPVQLTAYDGSGKHTVYGFPGGGSLRPVTGNIVDDRTFLLARGDYPVAMLSAPTVGGQSGGGVVTDRGMVGVMWGCDSEGHANMTCGKPFDEFLVSLTQSYSCYGGQCWAPSQSYSPGGRTIVSNGNPGPSIGSNPQSPPPVQPPTVNPDTPRELTSTAKAYIDQQITVQLAGKECQCDPDTYVTQAEFNKLTAAMTKITETVDQNFVKVTNNFESVKAVMMKIEDKIPAAYKPPTPEQQAVAILPYLPPVRVQWKTLGGQTLTQQKPLGEPLKFESVEVGVK